MKEIKLSFSDQMTRDAEYYLRKLYVKDKKTSLQTLCMLAVYKELRKAVENEIIKLDKE